MLTRLAASLVAILLFGCGGKVSRDGDETGSPGQAAGGAATGEESLPRGSLSLPPCEEGFVLRDEPTRFCAWLGSDGRCYDTKREACACLCRENSGAFCSSPLFADEERIPVDCF